MMPVGNAFYAFRHGDSRAFHAHPRRIFAVPGAEGLTFRRKYIKIACGVRCGRAKTAFPGVAQMVERVVWDHEAAGSRPVTRTRKSTACAVLFALPHPAAALSQFRDRSESPAEQNTRTASCAQSGCCSVSSCVSVGAGLFRRLPDVAANAARAASAAAAAPTTIV